MGQLCRNSRVFVSVKDIERDTFSVKNGTQKDKHFISPKDPKLFLALVQRETTSGTG